MRCIAMALVWLLGCERPAPPLSPTPEAELSPVFIDADFLELYQGLLLDGLTPTEKVARWARHYKQRWVVWTGQLAHAKREVLMFRHLGTTTISDVDLQATHVPGRQPPQLIAGRFYTYVGRLQRYDEDFRTLYLDQGVIFEVGPDGVPGVLAVPPEPSRRFRLPAVLPPPATPPLP